MTMCNLKPAKYVLKEIFYLRFTLPYTCLNLVIMFCKEDNKS